MASRRFVLLGSDPQASNSSGSMGATVLALLAVPFLWAFGYGSTLTPWLGYADRTQEQVGFARIGVEKGYSPGDTTGFGLTTMWLAKGQRAFIDYEVDSSAGGGVILDINRREAFGFSPRRKLIRGSAKGSLEFTVPEAGLYRFHHDFAVGGGRTRYKVTWGAR